MSSKPRIFAVENKLAQIASQPGGRRPEEAIRAANAKIEGVRGASLNALGEKVEQMVVLAAEGRAANDISAFGRIYDLSNAIYGLAGQYNLTALAEASFSLCDLADCFRGGEPANWPAIEVHVDGIRLLASQGEKMSPAGSEPILEGLRRVRARVMPAA